MQWLWPQPPNTPTPMKQMNKHAQNVLRHRYLQSLLSKRTLIMFLFHLILIKPVISIKKWWRFFRNFWRFGRSREMERLFKFVRELNALASLDFRAGFDWPSSSSWTNLCIKQEPGSILKKKNMQKLVDYEFREREGGRPGKALARTKLKEGKHPLQNPLTPFYIQKCNKCKINDNWSKHWCLMLIIGLSKKTRRILLEQVALEHSNIIQKDDQTKRTKCVNLKSSKRRVWRSNLKKWSVTVACNKPLDPCDSRSRKLRPSLPDDLSLKWYDARELMAAKQFSIMSTSC